MTWRRETPYKFLDHFDNVNHAVRETMDYTVNLRNFFGFLLFYATGIIGLTLVLPISFILFNVLHGIDLFLITLIEKTSHGMDSNRSQLVQGLSVLLTLLFVLPIIVYFTPSIIYTKVKEKMDKRIERQRAEYDNIITQCTEDINRWGPPPPRRRETKEHKDFKPKKYLVPHNFVGERYVILRPGVYVGEGERVVIHTTRTRRDRVGRRIVYYRTTE